MKTYAIRFNSVNERIRSEIGEMFRFERRAESLDDIVAVVDFAAYDGKGKKGEGGCEYVCVGWLYACVCNRGGVE